MTPAGVIGLDGDMPWQLRSDLRRFKKLTMGGTLIMGRKTFESIGRPLPGRQTIVVSRNRHWQNDGVTMALDVDSAMKSIDRPQAHVVGGAEIYRLFMNRIDRWLVTRVWSSTHGDTEIEIDLANFRLESMTPVLSGPRDSVPTQFEHWQRIRKVSGQNTPSSP